MNLMQRIIYSNSDKHNYHYPQNHQYDYLIAEMNEYLQVSVDFNSYKLPGIQFWNKLESELIKSLNLDSINDVENGREALGNALEELIKRGSIPLIETESNQSIIDFLVSTYFGLDFLDWLFTDNTITEIFINDYYEVYVNRSGKLYKTPLSFSSKAHQRHVLDRLCIWNNVAPPSENCQITEFSLEDGSLVIVLFSTVTKSFMTVSISRCVSSQITVEQLIDYNSVSIEIIEFLKASVQSELNILMCGDRYLLYVLVNTLSGFIYGDERIISIEYEQRFSLKHNHMINLIADKNTNSENSYEKLLSLTTNLFADRLILEKCTSKEIFDVLNIIRIDFPGSIISYMSESPSDAIEGLETQLLIGKPSLPLSRIRKLISSSLDLIVYMERLVDGSRVVSCVTEIGFNNDKNSFILNNIFECLQLGVENGRVKKSFVSKNPPSEILLRKFEYFGIKLPPDLFGSSRETKKNQISSEIKKRALKFSKGKYGFMCYSREDKKYVENLSTKLENMGFDIWLDVWDIAPGEDWTVNLQTAIKNAGVFIIILTPDSVMSQFVRNELTVALTMKLPIIPILVEECEIPITIQTLQYIKLNQDNDSDSMEIIFNALSKFITVNRPIDDETLDSLHFLSTTKMYDSFG